jgi:hypothetical protein
LPFIRRLLIRNWQASFCVLTLFAAWIKRLPLTFLPRGFIIQPLNIEPDE